jgi:hypothetical protein
MLGTKWPSMMSTCSQSAPWPMVSEHALPREPKSALRIEGAMNAGGAIVRKELGCWSWVEKRLQLSMCRAVCLVHVCMSTTFLNKCTSLHTLPSRLGGELGAAVESARRKPKIDIGTDQTSRPTTNYISKSASFHQDLHLDNIKQRQSTAPPESISASEYSSVRMAKKPPISARHAV